MSYYIVVLLALSVIECEIGAILHVVGDMLAVIVHLVVVIVRFVHVLTCVVNVIRTCAFLVPNPIISQQQIQQQH